MCRSEDFFLRGADEIKVFTDAKGLKGLYEGELGKIENSRLQGMMEKLMPYNLNFFHVLGKENEVADFGSRYPRSELKGEEFPIFTKRLSSLKEGSRKTFRHKRPGS